jgi:hypothetical protein
MRTKVEFKHRKATKEHLSRMVSKEATTLSLLRIAYSPNEIE